VRREIKKQGTREVRVNRHIKAREVRVIDPDGNQLGIMPLDEALNSALEMDLDLVEVATKSDPPVCRIMDYGKFKYQQSKKSQESRKKQVVIHLKEIKLRPKTDEHDFQFKIRHMERFLKEGNKVKVSMIFRGREIMHPDIGEKILQRVIEFTKELGIVEQAPKKEGRAMNMILKYQQSKKSQESRKKQVVIHLKEIKLRPKTDEHDFQFKVRHMERFLKEGNKVKVSMIFRGREIMHPDIGEKILQRVIEFTKELGIVEQAPKKEGRAMNMILAPIQSTKGRTSVD